MLHPEFCYVIVSGPPASGKTTLARPLARGLGLPLVSKDTIKDALMSELAVPDIDGSRRMGRASMVILIAVARDIGYGLLEAPWHRSSAAPALNDLAAPIVEVFCRCDRDTATLRYRARAGSRGPGHFDRERTAAELWNDEVSQPVAGGWPVIEVDSTQPVDIGELIGNILRVQSR